MAAVLNHDFLPPATSLAQARNSAATTPEQRAHMAPTADDSHGATFSRSTGLPAHMGKATAEAKCKLPEGMKDDFVRRAHSVGLTESELLRSVIMVFLYGVEEAERMQLAQFRAAAGIGPVSATNEAAGA